MFECPGVFVKVQLISGRKMLDQKMTAKRPADLDPAFSETMTFTVTNKQINTSSIVITIMTSRVKGEGRFDFLQS